MVDGRKYRRSVPCRRLQLVEDGLGLAIQPAGHPPISTPLLGRGVERKGPRKPRSPTHGAPRFDGSLECLRRALLVPRTERVQTLVLLDNRRDLRFLDRNVGSTLDVRSRQQRGLPLQRHGQAQEAARAQGPSERGGSSQVAARLIRPAGAKGGSSTKERNERLEDEPVAGSHRGTEANAEARDLVPDPSVERQPRFEQEGLATHHADPLLLDDQPGRPEPALCKRRRTGPERRAGSRQEPGGSNPRRAQLTGELEGLEAQAFSLVGRANSGRGHGTDEDGVGLRIAIT